MDSQETCSLQLLAKACELKILPLASGTVESMFQLQAYHVSSDRPACISLEIFFLLCTHFVFSAWSLAHPLHPAPLKAHI